MEDYRTCSDCKQSLPFSKFSKDKSRKYGISYRCKDCHAARNLTYYDKEKFAEYQRNHYAKNREALNAKQREKRLSDNQASRDYKKNYYQKNKNRINALSNAWRKDNPEVGRVSKRRRRARIALVESERYTTEQVLKKFGSKCHLCQEPIDLDAPRWTAQPGWERGLHLDHVVRIADGGLDVLENIRPAHAQCNLKKH